MAASWLPPCGRRPSLPRATRSRSWRPCKVARARRLEARRLRDVVLRRRSEIAAAAGDGALPVAQDPGRGDPGIGRGSGDGIIAPRVGAGARRTKLLVAGAFA